MALSLLLLTFLRCPKRDVLPSGQAIKPAGGYGLEKLFACEIRPGKNLSLYFLFIVFVFSVFELISCDHGPFLFLNPSPVASIQDAENEKACFTSAGNRLFLTVLCNTFFRFLLQQQQKLFKRLNKIRTNHFSSALELC
jgi:hypothetical protein